MTPADIDVARLREMLAIVVGEQPLPWSVWTSCSFRRVSCTATGGDGDVLHAYIQRSDGHPDLSMGEDRLKPWIELTNALPALLDTIEALRAENERLAEEAVRGINMGYATCLERATAAEQRVAVLEAEAELSAAEYIAASHANDFLSARLTAAEQARDRALEALRPFAMFAETFVDIDGWNGPMKTTRIVDWFGPSDFREARAVVDQEGAK